MVQQHQIKAIETVYKGYRFRSRLEARWAVFFDEVGVTWEYEKEGFELGDGLRYLPDFWLPHLNCWVEIKPDVDLPISEGEKLTAFGTQETHPLYLCRGLPGQFEMIMLWNGKGTDGFSWWECSGCHQIMPARFDAEACKRSFWLQLHDPLVNLDHVRHHALCFVVVSTHHPSIGWKAEDHFTPHETDWLREGYDAARQARFEHGENGGPR